MIKIQGSERPRFYFAVLILIVTAMIVFAWWLASNGPYPLLTLTHKSEVENILNEHWKSLRISDGFPPPRVAIVSVFEHTENCSVVSAVLYFRQGIGENAIENPSGRFYWLAREDTKWMVVEDQGGSDLRQQPNNFYCDDQANG